MWPGEQPTVYRKSTPVKQADLPTISGEGDFQFESWTWSESLRALPEIFATKGWQTEPIISVAIAVAPKPLECRFGVLK